MLKILCLSMYYSACTGRKSTKHNIQKCTTIAVENHICQRKYSKKNKGWSCVQAK